MSAAAPQVFVHEVGLRDGLQMEKQVVPTEQKIAWIEALLGSGVDILQLGSFVHPEKVPQMADTDRLFAHFSAPGRKPENVVLSGLVLNEKGLERGLACGVDMFCMGVSASETHSRKNTGMGIEEANQRIIGIAKSALAAGKRVQVSVQSAFGCGYEGPVPKERVRRDREDVPRRRPARPEPGRHRRPRDARRRSRTSTAGSAPSTRAPSGPATSTTPTASPSPTATPRAGPA